MDGATDHKRVMPYPHQVGGHGQLTMSSSGRLLKPLLAKEYAFYQYIHSEQLPHDMRWIRRNTPQFYGRIDAGAHKTARPRSPPSPSSPSQPQLGAGRRNGAATFRWRGGDGAVHTAVSPWAAQMKTRNLNAAAASRPDYTHMCIKLEDINSKFVIPCVIDCKIGTRHYDDDASEEKRQRHIRKANATTSAKCGVRFTGMQSFKRCSDSFSNNGMFESRDKYHGRTLREQDLVPELTWFFSDNFRVRTDCVSQVLERVVLLRRHLMQQRHFYFYSSSLLIVYEGTVATHAPTKVDVRMIDFAHTVRSYGHRDEGYLKGIDYLISILNRILHNERDGAEEEAACSCSSTSTTTTTTSSTSTGTTSSSHGHSGAACISSNGAAGGGGGGGGGAAAGAGTTRSAVDCEQCGA